MDYTRHTLDGAACLLNSNKYFPSRVSIKESSVAKLGSVCRRVYRIFYIFGHTVDGGNYHTSTDVEAWPVSSAQLHSSLLATEQMST